jgi:hypothetical protein
MYHEENAVRIEKKKSKSKFPFLICAARYGQRFARHSNCGMIDPTFSLRTEWYVFFSKIKRKLNNNYKNKRNTHLSSAMAARVAELATVT